MSKQFLQTTTESINRLPKSVIFGFLIGFLILTIVPQKNYYLGDGRREFTKVAFEQYKRGDHKKMDESLNFPLAIAVGLIAGFLFNIVYTRKLSAKI